MIKIEGLKRGGHGHSHHSFDAVSLKFCPCYDPPKSSQARKSGDSLDSNGEMSLIVRSVCATKLPTLTFDDNRRFRDLLQVRVGVWGGPWLAEL